MFFGWEAVGLSSYLLINFWSTRNQANQAAIKAIVFNRFGDIAFMTALGLISICFKSFDFEIIELLLPDFKQTSLILFSYSFPVVELLAFFLFLAAAAKSAQLLFHAWLPDAMEGPTPVSALLHSATMVTAGVFLILRSSLIIENAPHVSFLIAVIGLLTANISSFTGLLQFDIKRIIAFSTCSQLGYMVFAAGIGNYSFALFHLINHAFFKALLFLCAGSVIHATGEQDIRYMGALFKTLPITYITMLLASLSLIGFPFLSGFYGKDFLLEATFANFGQLSYFIYIFSTISAFVSSFYSFRLIYLVFFGEVALSKKVLINVREGSLFLFTPLIVLSLFSIFSGFMLKDLMVLHSSFYFFNTSPISNISLDIDFFSDFFKIIPSISAIFGLLSVYGLYCSRIGNLGLFYKRYVLIVYLFAKKFFADGFNYVYFYIHVNSFGLNTSYKLLDKGLYETFGPEGIYYGIESLVSYILNIETSVIIYRLLLMLITAVLGVMALSVYKYLLLFPIAIYILFNHSYQN